MKAIMTLGKMLVIFWCMKNLYFIFKKIKKADIVHIPIPSDIGTIGMIIAKIMNKPLLIRHCGNWKNQRTIAEKFWKYFMINFTKKNVISYATGGGKKTPTNKNKDIEWIYSTSLLNAELIKLSKIQINNNNDNKIKIIIVCRQIREKGTEIIIKSLSILNNNNLELDVVGDGEDLEYFKKICVKLKLINKIKFWGRLDNNEVIHKMLKSDLFCYPTYSSEGFPKVILEAMACGLPIITTKVSVLPELVGKNNAGMILKKTCSTELAKTIDYLINNKSILKIMSKNALRSVKEYSLENWADLIASKLSIVFDKDVKRIKKIIK